jgi:WD40 repeat protein
VLIQYFDFHNITRSIHVLIIPLKNIILIYFITKLENRTKMNNQNLLKLVFSSLMLCKTKSIFNNLNSKSLCETILKTSKHIMVVYRSLGKSKILLQGHQNCITSIDTLPDNKLITASSDLIIIWEMDNYQYIKTLLPPKDYLGTVRALPEGLIVTCSTNGMLKFWDINKDYEEKRISFLKNYTDFDLLSLLSNGYLACTFNNDFGYYIVVIDHRNNCKWVKVILANYYKIIAFSNISCNKFVTSDNAYKIKIWDCDDDYKLVRILDIEAYALLFISKQNLLLCGSEDGVTNVLDAGCFRCIRSIPAHDDTLNSLLLLPRGYIASCSLDGKLKIWNMGKYECVNTLVGGKKSYEILSTLLLDDRIVTASDNIITIWNY